MRSASLRPATRRRHASHAAPAPNSSAADGSGTAAASTKWAGLPLKPPASSITLSGSPLARKPVSGPA